MHKRKVLYSLLLFFIFSTYLYSQAPVGEIKEYIVLENLDTLKIDRYHTDWWFGVSGGFGLGIDFSKLYIPEIIADDINLSKNKISYNSGTNSGVFLGLYGEWLPVNEMWGGTLRINLLEYRELISYSNSIEGTDKINYKFRNTSSSYYLSIAPSVRYNFPVENLYAFLGLDLEIKLSDEVLGKKEFSNSALIDHDKILKMNMTGFRIGINAGIGYDMFAADINRKVRAFISPFASLHIGSTEISDFGSSRMPLVVKIGANVKFNIDERKLDTIPLNPNLIETPLAKFSLKKEKGVDFGGFVSKENISIALSVVPQRIVQELKPSSEIKVEETVKHQPVNTETEPVKKNIVINPNKKKNINYTTSESSTLSKTDKEWLDALAEYLNKNPQATLRITGHSDDAGNTDQNMKRSQNRAAKVVEYLMKKGIARRRLLDLGKGALDPIADNKTEKGRAKNRRVEIEIIK